MRKYSKLAQF